MENTNDIWEKSVKSVVKCTFLLCSICLTFVYCRGSCENLRCFKNPFCLSLSFFLYKRSAFYFLNFFQEGKGGHILSPVFALKNSLPPAHQAMGMWNPRLLTCTSPSGSAALMALYRLSANIFHRRLFFNGSQKSPVATEGTSSAQPPLHSAIPLQQQPRTPLSAPDNSVLILILAQQTVIIGISTALTDWKLIIPAPVSVQIADTSGDGMEVGSWLHFQYHFSFGGRCFIHSFYL